jgi:hypothetical protein
MVRFHSRRLVCTSSLSGQSADPLNREMGNRGPRGTQFFWGFSSAGEQRTVHRVASEKALGKVL